MIEIDSYYDKFVIAKDIKKDESKYIACPVQVGLKVEVDKNALDHLQNHPYIQEHFKLNIKRLNTWRWSVYFDHQ